jgi:post-segregation antitoxin (ccd killing protein)
MQKTDTPMSRTTITVPTNMLVEAKEMRLNVSRVFQQSLASELARIKSERWAETNAEAIADYNADVLANGLLLKDQGTW